MAINIEILQAARINEMKELISIFEEVFEIGPFERPSDNHLQKLLNYTHFFAVIAKVDNAIVGGLTVYALDRYYAEKPLAYINDLAVLTSFQRKGIGQELIAFTKDYCCRKGFEEAFVQEDKVDDYAVDFYRFTKPSREEEVVHFS